ncbi:hypothetical protein BDK92_7348 [Micromonospora pisi]|uniref:Uncharacterized protein n=1 Tax=Micromonospora pisi TaxID=589240 RepID=A0A495JV20_9ACTN|nr:hypothetical protein [Micromonospora pisi]RKR92866.1 hypothetical protein BDK92_7348 [Micromonospora pisi]
MATDKRTQDWYVQAAVTGAPPLSTAVMDRLRSLIGADSDTYNAEPGAEVRALNAPTAIAEPAEPRQAAA